MLLYNDYYNRMQAIQDALNAETAPIANINTTGLTPREAAYYIFGRYIQSLLSATYPSFSVAKCESAVSILVYAMRELTDTKRFDFALFDPDSVAKDAQLEEVWCNEYIDYTRMSSPMMIGVASCIAGTNECVCDSDFIDFDVWCNLQALHLANYCIAHDINLIKVS